MAMVTAQLSMAAIPRNEGPAKTPTFPLKNVITFTTPSYHFQTLSPSRLINYFARCSLLTLLPGDLAFCPSLHEASPTPIKAVLSARPTHSASILAYLIIIKPWRALASPWSRRRRGSAP